MPIAHTGHSERRQYFGETDETVNKRTKAALAAGLKPIVCVGELLWERECDITEEVIARQIKLDLFNVTEEELKNVVISQRQMLTVVLSAVHHSLPRSLPQS